MVLVQPDDLAGVVIDDHGHVLVALAIRGFVHADADQPVEASLVGIGVQVLLCACHASPHGVPIDAHEFFDFRAGHVPGQPRNLEIEFFGEA